MINLNKNITDITVGIRFQRSFRIQDVLGALTDNLLHDEDSPLDTENFPQLNKNISGIILSNANGSYLRANTDDIIFKHIVTKNIDKELNFIVKYLKYIRKIIKMYDIKNINRIGIIYKYKIENDQKKFVSAINTITDNQLSNIDDFSLSFSKKISDKSSIIKKGVNDYKNVIYLFRKISDRELSIGLDFQKYFAPPLDEIENKDFEGFIDDSKQYLKNNFFINFVESNESKK